MGLDMYLTARRKPHRIGEGALETEAMYWRKANAIHKWFVDNVQGGKDECNEHFVSIEQLTKLRDVCAAVLADKSKAAALLPPKVGFFFGGTEIDDHYMQYVLNTVEKLDELLCTVEVVGDTARSIWEDYDFYYCSSW
jgi:hypothetical protein